ncbi:hypothetical protein C8Q74DRAFT_1362767 [Fomes fomentarius]|nr:hypothetical protein C8Q74DRAFT_1362767 [Fomes fomentarius]
MADGAPVQWSRSPAGSETSIRLVRAYLAYLGLPVELVLYTMGLARYYPAVYVKRTAHVDIRASGELFSNSAAQLYLVTPPLPRTQDSEYWAVREVIWHIESRDQGWGGEAPGKYHPAWSWHDACVFRRVDSYTELPVEHGDPPFNGEVLLHEEVPREHHVHAARDEAADGELPARSLEPYYRNDGSGPEPLIRATLESSRWRLVGSHGSHSCFWRLQSNRVAHEEYERHKVVWTAEEVGAMEEMSTVEERGAWSGNGFVHTLRPGDRIGLWMRALYPGWENDVLEASIEVLYFVR